MNGWKTPYSSGIGSALQRRFVAPAGRRLMRAGQVTLPRKLRMELNARDAAASRNELHPGILLVFRSGHVVLNNIGLLVVAVAVVPSLNSEWCATVAQRVLHFMPGVGTSVASASPSPVIAADMQSVAFVPTAPSADTSATQAVAPATAQGGTVVAAD